MAGGRLRDTAGNYIEPDALIADTLSGIATDEDLQLAVNNAVSEALDTVATDEELNAALAGAIATILDAVATDEELETALSTAVAQVLEQAATDAELRAAIETALESIEPGDTFVTNIATTEEFITQLVTEEFVTQVVENNTYVTNVTNVINARKGVANELATLDANSHHTPSQIPPGAFELTIDGGGVVITTGVKFDFEVPFACNLIGWTLLADVSGSIVIDVWKDSYANFPPTVADSISTSKPTLSSAQKAQDNTITDWSEALAAGDILRFNVDSVATIKRATLVLKYQRT